MAKRSKISLNFGKTQRGGSSSLKVIWTVIAFIALATDLITSNFLFVCFAVGAIFALIASTMGFSAFVQFSVFFLISSTCFAFVFTKGKAYLQRTVEKIKTPEELLIGRKIVLEEDVEGMATIKLDGFYRTVKASEPLKKGDTAVIEAVEGNKLIIRKGNSRCFL